MVLQPTLKKDCPACLKIRKIKIFPDYRITETIDMNNWKRTKLKKETLDGLRDDIQTGKARSVDRFYLLVPTKEAHKHHDLNSVANAVIQPVHKDVLAKIHDLVNQGIDSVREVKHILRDYVANVIFKDNIKKLDYANQGYFPIDKNIRNHIDRAKMLNQFSKIDQENFVEKVKEWKAASPDSKFHFRPSATKKPCDSEELLSGNTEGQGDKLLYVHQTPWQQILLKRYGKILLLDATYKTMNYALPLFLVCVKTNISYIVVGEFVIEDENIESIAEALKVLKDWNGSLDPLFFMTDCSLAEINAIESVFPGAIVFLCDFHRNQAWERWVKKNVNEVPEFEKKVVLSMMHRIANANSKEKMERAIENLRTSALWGKNEHLRTYMDTKWLPDVKRWVKYFRSGILDTVINTNNGVEAQNKVLKHSFLCHHSDKSLTGVMTVINEQFLPEAYQKYSQANTRMTTECKSYGPETPKFLVNRPHHFIKHVQSRMFSANDWPENGINVTDPNVGIFEVLSLQGEPESPLWYTVNFSMPSCECPDWEKFRYPCKHFCAVFRRIPSWGFSALPESYRCSPFLTLDACKKQENQEQAVDDHLELCLEVEDDDVGVTSDSLDTNLPNSSSSINFQHLPPLRRNNIKQARAICCTALASANTAA